MKKIKLSRKPKLKFEVVRTLVVDDLRRVHGGNTDQSDGCEANGTSRWGRDYQVTDRCGVPE